MEEDALSVLNQITELKLNLFGVRNFTADSKYANLYLRVIRNPKRRPVPTVVIANITVYKQQQGYLTTLLNVLRASEFTVEFECVHNPILVDWLLRIGFEHSGRELESNFIDLTKEAI